MQIISKPIFVSPVFIEVRNSEEKDKAKNKIKELEEKAKQYGGWVLNDMVEEEFAVFVTFAFTTLEMQLYWRRVNGLEPKAESIE